MANITCMIYADIELPDILDKVDVKETENETNKLKIIVVRE